MVKAKRWARIQDLIFIGIYGGGLLALSALLFMFYAAMSSPDSMGTFSNFGKVFVVIVLAYLGFALAYIPYVAHYWDPNRRVDRGSYEASKARDVDDEERLRSLKEYRRATRIALKLGSEGASSSEARLSLRDKVLIIASCALAILAFLSPTLFPSMVAVLNESGLMMLPFYVGVLFLLITTIGSSWRILYKFML